MTMMTPEDAVFVIRVLHYRKFEEGTPRVDKAQKYIADRYNIHKATMSFLEAERLAKAEWLVDYFSEIPLDKE
jgi:hypothetical protein